MHWFWWAVIAFAAVCILNFVCQENPAFRQVFCCIIAVVYPVLMLIFQEQSMTILIIGTLALGFYKYVFGLAEIMEEEGPPDIFTMFAAMSDGEITVITVLFSIVSALIFAAVAIIPIAFLMDISEFLAMIWIFAPAVYCIVTTVLFFRENY